MRVGIVGYGRFGRALGALVEEAGGQVRAWDPVSPVPAAHRTEGLDALGEGSEFIAVAVPILALRESLGQLAPRLGAGQVCFDVGSVKVEPCRWMAEILGPSRPFAGTHPLFGPVSLARAERPLRVVLCPAPQHPAAAQRVAALFSALGCEVLSQSPEDHDRVMATTHALTYFLAKGLLEVGAGAELPFTPPSFHAIQRTLEAVREDAGHLFTALQNQNPFAAGARESLLEALQSIHRDLLEAGSHADPAPRLAIPELVARSPQLQEVRDVIDSLDREILDLLSRRMELARRAGRAKEALGAPVLDPGREQALLESRREWAAGAGMEPAAAEEVFRAILRMSRRTQGS